MAKILIAVVAALACFVLAESLDCNKCTVGLLGVCLGTSTETCSNSSDICFTSKASFPSISSFSGFTSQGCTAFNTCGTSNSTTTNGTLAVIGVTYSVKTDCCKTNKCNPKTVSGASSSAASLSLLSVAALAAMMKSYM